MEWWQPVGVAIAAAATIGGLIGRAILNAIRQETAKLASDLAANTRSLDETKVSTARTDACVSELSKSSLRQELVLATLQQTVVDHVRQDDSRFSTLQATTELLRQRDHDNRDDMVAHVGEVMMKMDDRVVTLEKAEAVRRDRDTRKGTG